MKVLRRTLGFVLAFLLVFGVANLAPLDGFEPVVAEAAISASYTAPSVNPPANEHPRVMFRASDIPALEAAMDDPQNAADAAKVNNYVAQIVRHGASTTLSANSSGVYYDELKLAKIEATAFNYAIYGNADSGAKAVEGIMNYLTTLNYTNSASLGTSTDEITRHTGYVIYVAAEIYDWCYDILSSSQKSQIISICETIAKYMEIGYPPTGQSAINGHGSESQLLRSLLAFAIATYDERPDIWKVVGGRFYQEYVPTRNITLQGHYNIEGDTYGQYRHLWDSWAYKLITAMGVVAPYDLDNLTKTSYGYIYMRRPDGQLLRDGDTAADEGKFMWQFWTDYKLAMAFDYSLGLNPYIKSEFINRTGNGTSAYENSSVPFIILNSGAAASMEPYGVDNLPQAKHFPYPAGMSIARTGWSHGAEAPDVVAEMKVGGLLTMNHQHLDAGHFQIYYKGILASDSGVYQGKKNDSSSGGTSYSSEHRSQYAAKTVAHNSILFLRSPDTYGTTIDKIRDGGQETTISEGTYSSLTTTAVNACKTSTVERQEIDPNHDLAPEYTYLKGDLKNAYPSFVSTFKRSFMFFDMKRTDVPGVMVIYDYTYETSASNTSNYERRWVLHGLEQPTVSGQQAIFKRTYSDSRTNNRYNGKMTVDNLVPGNVTINTVGGSSSDGSDSQVWDNGSNTKYPGYPLEDKSSQDGMVDEGSTWRIEMVPTGNTKTNRTNKFLNVIQVSDADKSNYLTPTKVTNQNTNYPVVGVQIGDRVVTFAENGNVFAADCEIEFTTTGSGTFKYTVCDLPKGTYEVSVGGSLIGDNYVATSDGGVISFEAPAGAVDVVYSSGSGSKGNFGSMVPTTNTSNYVLTNYPGSSRDFFVYAPNSSYTNDEEMIPLSTLTRYAGVTGSTDGSTATLTGSNNTVTLTDGSNIATSSKSGVSDVEMNNPATVTSSADTTMIPSSALKLVGANVKYSDTIDSAYISNVSVQQANGVSLSYSIDNGETFTPIPNFDYTVSDYSVELPDDVNIVILKGTDETGGTFTYTVQNEHDQAESDVAGPSFFTSTGRQFKLTRKSVDGRITIKCGEATGSAKYVDPNGFEWDYNVFFTSTPYKLKEFTSYMPSGNVVFISGGAAANDNGTLMDTASSSGKTNTWALGNISEYLIGQSMFMLPITEMGKGGSAAITGTTSDKFFSFKANRSCDVTILMANPAEASSVYERKWTKVNDGTSGKGITTGSSGRSPAYKNDYSNTDYFACAYNWRSNATATNPTNLYRTTDPGPDGVPSNSYIYSAATKLSYAYTMHFDPGETITIYNPGNITGETSAVMPIFLKWGDEYASFKIKYTADRGYSYVNIPNFSENVYEYNIALPTNTFVAQVTCDGDGEAKIYAYNKLRYEEGDYAPTTNGEPLIGDFHTEGTSQYFKNLYEMPVLTPFGEIPIKNEEGTAIVKYTPTGGTEKTYTINFSCRQPRLTSLYSYGDTNDEICLGPGDCGVPFISGAGAFNDNRSIVDASHLRGLTSSGEGRTYVLGNLSKALNGASMFVFPISQMTASGMDSKYKSAGNYDRRLVRFTADTPGKVILFAPLGPGTNACYHSKKTGSDRKGWSQDDGGAPADSWLKRSDYNGSGKKVTRTRYDNDYTNVTYTGYFWNFWSAPGAGADDSRNAFRLENPGITGTMITGSQIEKIAQGAHTWSSSDVNPRSAAATWEFERPFAAGEEVIISNPGNLVKTSGTNDSRYMGINFSTNNLFAALVVWDICDINIAGEPILDESGTNPVLSVTLDEKTEFDPKQQLYVAVYRGKELIYLQKQQIVKSEAYANVGQVDYDFTLDGVTLDGSETIQIMALDVSDCRPVLKTKPAGRSYSVIDLR